MLAGTVLDGRYRVARRLGRGGFAWVYEGEHVDLGRSAAVKVLDLPRNATDAKDFVERFLREARIIARISHPNVVSVYDFGIIADTGQPYIAMELLRGHDLEVELGTNGPLVPERARKLFVGALDALDEAHAEGVVHKDLKPSNLFLADPGTTKERLVLLDFGIAWAYDDDARLTQVGAFTGTPAYVAPEYARSQTVSPAVDVYQMGLILSEALSCVPCVNGASSVSMILAHCQGEVVIPEALDRSVFGGILRKATALDPTARYEDGGAFRDALTGIDVRDMPRLVGAGEIGEARTAQFVFTHSEDRRTDPMVASGAAAEGFAATEPSMEVPVLVEDSTPVDAAQSQPAHEEETTSNGQILVLAAAMMALIVAVGLFALRALESEAPVATMPDEPPPAVPDPEPIEVVVAPAEPPTAVEEFPTEESIENLPRFSVRSTPMGAAVYRGKERLGLTPFVLRGDEVDGSTVTLRYELMGFGSKEVEVSLLDGGVADVELASDEPAGRNRAPNGPRPGDLNSAMNQVQEVLNSAGRNEVMRAPGFGEDEPPR